MNAEIDEFKTLWGSYGRVLEENLALNRTLLLESRLRSAAGALRPLKNALVMEIITGLIGAVWMGYFIGTTWGDWRFTLPAVALDMFAIGLTIAAIAQLTALRKIDFGGPVVAIQRALGGLRIERLRVITGALLLGPLLWPPAAVVASRAWFGIDLYAAAGTYVLACALFGCAVLAGGLWVAMRYGRALNASLFTSLISGESLDEANRFLERLETFASEPAA